MPPSAQVQPKTPVAHKAVLATHKANDVVKSHPDARLLSIHTARPNRRLAHTKQPDKRLAVPAPIPKKARSRPRMQTPVTIEDEPEPSIICVSSSQPEESTDQVDQSLTELSSLVDGYGEAVFACSSTADSQDSSQSPSTTNPGRSIIQAKKQIIDYFRAAQTGATEMIAKLQGEVDKANTSAREKGTEVEKLLRESGRLKAKLANEQNYTLAYRDARDKALKEVKEAKEKYEVLSEKQARSRKRAREVFETSKRVKLE